MRSREMNVQLQGGSPALAHCGLDLPEVRRACPGTPLMSMNPFWRTVAGRGLPLQQSGPCPSRYRLIRI